MTSPREKLGLLLGFAGVVLFGGTLPATRIAVAALDPWFVTSARAALAGAAALTLLLLLRRPLPTRRQWKELAAATLLDRKSTRLNSSHIQKSRMPSSA